eukprot:gene1833-4932_t
MACITDTEDLTLDKHGCAISQSTNRLDVSLLYFYGCGWTLLIVDHEKHRISKDKSQSLHEKCQKKAAKLEKY